MRQFLFILPLFFMVVGFQRIVPGDGDPGKALYERNCVRCHGANGAKGAMGAKDLQKSILPDAAIVKQIQKGSWIMPSFKKKLTYEEIQELVVYIKTLRTN